MKITSLEVDGFGVWSGLKLDDLSKNLNVFYGPNEAGKTTLMHFVRSVLYGSDPSRERYLPPLHGGNPGGSVNVAAPQGSFHLQRHLDSGPEGDRISITGPDGSPQSEHLLKALLYDVDEPVFNNVFAVGLRELQELGTLSDTDASSMLYRLSAGLDRVSLVDVSRDLNTSRNRLIDARGASCEIAELHEAREKLLTEIEELGTLTHRYGRLAAEHDDLKKETRRAEREVGRLRRESQLVGLAVGLRERLKHRKRLDDQLSAFGPVEAMPEGTLERLDDTGEQLTQHQRTLERYTLRREELRHEAESLGIHEKAARLSPRVEALMEQQSWFGTLESRVKELETEIASLEERLAEERQRMGVTISHSHDSYSILSTRALDELRRPAREMRDSRRRLEEMSRDISGNRQTADSLSERIERALDAHGERSLGGAIERLGALAAQLRRRVQIDERLSQMDHYQTELEEQGREVVEYQLLPVWGLTMLGMLFVAGFVMAWAGLISPTSATSMEAWLYGLIGVAFSTAAVGGKHLLEYTHSRRFIACQKQARMLQLQTRRAQEERHTLNEQLPVDDRPPSVRLEAAERELATLEELVPLDARRKVAHEEKSVVSQQIEQAEADLERARQHWQRALVDQGLPPDLEPSQVKSLFHRGDEMSEIKRVLDARYEELQKRSGELQSLTQRIEKLAVDTGVNLSDDHPIQNLHVLAGVAADQEERLGRLETVRTEAKLLKRKRTRIEATISQLEQRRRELLFQAGVQDENEFRRLVAHIAHVRELMRERDHLNQDLIAALAGQCTLDEVLEQFDLALPRAGLEGRREEIEHCLKDAEEELQKRFESRGGLAEQIKAVTEDRRPAEKQLELAIVEKNLERAVAKWQPLAVTSRIVRSLRVDYERERQPETLREASGYLEKMTRGRYTRVWTPLGEDELYVDMAEGDSRAVEMLSTGTREQLFVCLRLALASSYAKRGVRLPLVLDDVLVNFDVDRSKAAARLLRDFASTGHQLLVFTCHEHISKIFKALSVKVHRLPSRGEPAVIEPEPIIEPEPKPKPKLKSRPKPKPLLKKPRRRRKPKKLAPTPKFKERPRKEPKPLEAEIVIEPAFLPNPEPETRIETPQLVVKTTETVPWTSQNAWDECYEEEDRENEDYREVEAA